MGFKIVRTERRKKKDKKLSESEKLTRHRVQYTKIAVSTMLILTIFVLLGSLYINLKTQSNMDTIAVKTLDTFWAVFLVYGVKSYFETKAEKKLEGFKKEEDEVI